MHTAYLNKDRAIIAISEMCDGHFIESWGEVNKDLTLEEFKGILSAHPNSETAMNILDIMMFHYGKEATVKEAIFWEE